jgi:hypothetical protein
MVTTTPTVIAGLASRLTNTRDRETYSELMCYLGRLPPGDEFRQLAELLGLLSLVGQRIPEALGEFLVEFRAQTKAEADYHGQVDARLASLPQEIAAGVDPTVIAKGMSESFRQQLAASGLQETAALLKAAVITLRTLSGEVTTTLKPVASTLSDEMEKLLTAARRVEEFNSQLVDQKRASQWLLQGLVGMVVFALGVLYGGVVEKRQTSDLLSNIGVQLQRIQLLAQPDVKGSKKP